MERLAGKGSELFDRHGMYLDLVRGSLLYLPVEPSRHAYPVAWRHFDVTVLDVADVCVAKASDGWVPTARTSAG